MLKFTKQQSNVLLLNKSAYHNMQNLIVNLNNEQKKLVSSPFLNIKIDDAMMAYCYQQLQSQEDNRSELKAILENLLNLIGETIFDHFIKNSQLVKKFDSTLLQQHLGMMILHNLSGYIQSNSVTKVSTLDNAHESLNQLLENDPIFETVSTTLNQYSNQISNQSVSQKMAVLSPSTETSLLKLSQQQQDNANPTPCYNELSEDLNKGEHSTSFVKWLGSCFIAGFKYLFCCLCWRRDDSAKEETPFYPPSTLQQEFNQDINHLKTPGQQYRPQNSPTHNNNLVIK